MVLLLSPAKTLDFDAKAPVDSATELRFPDRTSYLAGKLKKMSPRKLKSLMGISEDLAQLNAGRYQNWELPTKKNGAKQAAFAFKGDVYQGLEAEKLSKDDLKYAQGRVAILSGLYGILRPLDLMQPYRLEMGTSWEITKKKNSLYKFWKETLTTEIAKMLEASGSGFLLNLASKEYAKAVDLKHMDVPVIAPQFKEERNGGFKMISFFAKEARGMMAAYAIKNRITEPEDLKGFDYGNYGFNERLSDTGKHKWVFTRKTT